MKVVVFGATGFVGSQIVSALTDRGITPHSMRAPRLAYQVGDGEGIDCHHATLISSLASSLRGVDVVINAAGVPDADSTDVTTLNGANGVVPGVLAAAARLAGVRRFIHVSSAAVQGRRRVLDDSEKAAPLSVYGRSKALGERFAVRFGPPQTVVYRPPGVHGASRSTTQALARLARSRLSVAVSPGNQPTPQALAENVGDAIAFIALWKGTAPRFVSHPSEGLTTASLLSALGERNPSLLPAALANRCLLPLLRHVQIMPKLCGLARRIEVLLFGQEQAGSWLTEQGWVPRHGLETWRRISREMSLSSDSPRPRRVLVVATVAEQLRVQYPAHFQLFKEAGLQIHVAAGASDNEISAACPQGVTAHSIPLARNLGVREVLSGVRALRQTVKTVQPDLVIYGSPAASLIGALSSFGIARRRIFVVHGLREETMAGLQKRKVVWASWVTAALSTNTVFASRSALQSARFVKPSRRRIDVADPGFIGIDVAAIARRDTQSDRQITRQSLSIPESSALVGFVGRLAKDKGVEELVMSIERLRSSGHDIELLLVGGADPVDPLPPTTEASIESNPHVHHVDHVDDPYPWYAAMDLFCLPSYREGLPTVILEAGAMRLPIVATRVTGNVDAVRDDEGWLCAPADARCLHDALSEAMRERSARKSKAERHAARISADFSLDAVRNWWSAFYGFDANVDSRHRCPTLKASL